MEYLIASPIDGMSYYVWLNKPIFESFSDGYFVAQFYLLFPSLWLESRINRNATPSKQEYIKKFLLHLALYPLTVILTNAFAKNLHLSDSIKDITHNIGVFGFFSGFLYQLIMSALTVLQNYVFVENDNIGYQRIRFWIIFQMLNVPLQILLQSLRLKNICGASQLENIGFGWFLGLLSQGVKQFKSFYKEITLMKDPRSNKFIGG